MTGPKRWVYDLQLDPRPQSGDRTAARKTHSQPEVQSTFGMGARYMSSGYLTSKSHVCFFVCVCLKKKKKPHHPLAGSKGFSAPPDFSFSVHEKPRSVLSAAPPSPDI